MRRTHKTASAVLGASHPPIITSVPTIIASSEQAAPALLEHIAAPERATPRADRAEGRLVASQQIPPFETPTGGMIGLASPVSDYAYSVEDARRIIDKTGLPIILRPSFTMGGAGGGIVTKMSEIEENVERTLQCSPTREVLVEGRRETSAANDEQTSAPPAAPAGQDDVSPRQWEVAANYIRALPKIDAADDDPDVDDRYEPTPRAIATELSVNGQVAWSKTPQAERDEPAATSPVPLDSPVLCDHANESPRQSPCDCPATCYCKTHEGGCGVAARNRHALRDSHGVDVGMFHDWAISQAHMAPPLWHALAALANEPNKLRHSRRWQELRPEVVSFCSASTCDELNAAVLQLSGHPIGSEDMWGVYVVSFVGQTNDMPYTLYEPSGWESMTPHRISAAWPGDRDADAIRAARVATDRKARVESGAGEPEPPKVATDDASNAAAGAIELALAKLALANASAQVRELLDVHAAPDPDADPATAPTDADSLPERVEALASLLDAALTARDELQHKYSRAKKRLRAAEESLERETERANDLAKTMATTRPATLQERVFLDLVNDAVKDQPSMQAALYKALISLALRHTDELDALTRSWHESAEIEAAHAEASEAVLRDARGPTG